MSVYGGQALRGNFAPLLWSAAGTAAMAGGRGLPGYGAANAFARMMTDKPLQQSVYESFGYNDADPLGQKLLDTTFYGLPALFGVTLLNRSAAPGAEMVRDANMLFSIAGLDRARFFGRALGDSVDKFFATGQHPVNSQGTRDLWLRALAPRTLYRFLQVTEDGALKSMNSGRQLISDVSFPERLANALGFTPLSFQRYYDASAEGFRRQDILRGQISTFGELVKEGWDARDPEAVKIAMRIAAEKGVPLDSVLRSARNRFFSGQRDLLDEKFKDVQTRATARALGALR